MINFCTCEYLKILIYLFLCLLSNTRIAKSNLNLFFFFISSINCGDNL